MSKKKCANTFISKTSPQQCEIILARFACYGAFSSQQAKQNFFQINTKLQLKIKYFLRKTPSFCIHLSLANSFFNNILLNYDVLGYKSTLKIYYFKTYYTRKYSFSRAIIEKTLILLLPSMLFFTKNMKNRQKTTKISDLYRRSYPGGQLFELDFCALFFDMISIFYLKSLN